MTCKTEPLRIKELMLHSLLLVALLALAFPATFLRGEVLAPGSILYEVPPWMHHGEPDPEMATNRLMLDTITAMNVYYSLCQGAVENGEWPLWNHMELAGIPLIANFQSTFFYFPRLVHLFLDTFVATTVFILLKLWLCGITMYVCGRLLGLRRAIAVFMSIGWMLSGYNLIWCYWPLADVAAWFPVLFLGVEYVLGRLYRRGFYVIALGGTLLLLAGHPETAFTMGLGLGAYFVFRLAWERRWGKDLYQPVFVALGAWGLALLLCAVQLLPFVEYFFNSYSVHDRAILDEFDRAGLKPSSVAAFFVPRFFGTWCEGNWWGDARNSNETGMLYAGCAVWVGVALMWCRNRDRTKVESARIHCLSLSCLLFLLLTFNLSTLSFLHALPLFQTILSEYYISYPIFALVMLAGFGMQRWFSQDRKLREMLWATPVLFVGTAIVAWVYLFNHDLLDVMGNLPYVAGKMRVAGLFVLGTLLVLALNCFFRKSKLSILVLAALLACDLLLAVTGINATSPRERLFPETELTNFLKEQEQPCRVNLGFSTIPSGLFTYYRIEEWGGYDGLYPERVMRFQEELGVAVWASMEPVCSIQYYLHDVRLDFMFPRDKEGYFTRVAAMEGMEVYRNNKAFPRAFLVGEARYIDEEAEMFEIMRSEDFDPASVVLVERPLPVSFSGSGGKSPGTAKVVQRSGTSLRIQVEAERDCVLVLSDAFYPGWTARIDGETSDIFPAYYAFRGVVVPAGSHTVTFSYYPWSFRIGLYISVVTLLMTVLLLAREFRLKRCVRKRQDGDHSP